MNFRTISDVSVGAAETLIQALLESPESIVWNSHWLISTLDSGDNFDYYADWMKTAGAGRGGIRVVSCGVLADPIAAAALRGSSFQLSWFSQLHLFADGPAALPPEVRRFTTDGFDFEDDDSDASVLEEMKTLGAYACLADGDWLNFATRSQALLAEIAEAEKRRKERGW